MAQNAVSQDLLLCWMRGMRGRECLPTVAFPIPLLFPSLCYYALGLFLVNSMELDVKVI